MENTEIKVAAAMLAVLQFAFQKQARQKGADAVVNFDEVVVVKVKPSAVELTEKFQIVDISSTGLRDDSEIRAAFSADFLEKMRIAVLNMASGNVNVGHTAILFDAPGTEYDTGTKLSMQNAAGEYYVALANDSGDCLTQRWYEAGFVDIESEIFTPIRMALSGQVSSGEANIDQLA